MRYRLSCEYLNKPLALRFNAAYMSSALRTQTMITKAALRASAKARKEGSTSFTRIVREGEVAAERGLPKSANPYTGTDWADAWDLGWEG
jgi:hypothetical protein